ncbi:FK506-binding protein 5-like [Camellia sinensis]|uniref:FK506-binding protein 5-like n=1 Tax=Camellia sinensis TaxID=4442 RepID=UPI0010358A32|nr:FK506-binding protein 5-like [Camellia sinensis]
MDGKLGNQVRNVHLRHVASSSHAISARHSSFILTLIDNKELVKNPSEEFCPGKKTKKESKKAIVKFNETLQDSSEEGGNEELEGNIEEYEASNGQEDQASSGEAEARKESKEIEAEDKEQNEQKEENSKEEDKQQEENKEESDEEERNKPMDQQRDSICDSTMHQPQESEESKDAQIADLRQRLKALSQSKKEEERNWIELLA